MNAYIIRQTFFIEYTGKMNSMHGFWIAMARWGAHWYKPSWWPYWYCGMPFEYTYAPLVPGLSSGIARLTGWTAAHGFQAVCGIVYCVAPAALFLMAWQLTGRPGWSFIASVLYSLTAPTELLLPDAPFSLAHLRDARRLTLIFVWDEAPHQLGLAMVCLAILFLARALRDRHFRDFVCAGLFVSLALLSSAFGATGLLLFGACLLATCTTGDRKRNIGAAILCGALGYVAMCPFLPPSLIFAIRRNAALFSHMAWLPSSTPTFAGVLAGSALVWWISRRWKPSYLRFMLLLAWVCTIIPVLYVKRDLHFLPQSARYKVEMEVALPLLIVFAIATAIDRLPKLARVILAIAVLWPAYQQVIYLRRYSKNVIRSVDITQSFEYQVARWIEANLPGWRVMSLGSIGQWLNTFSPVPQFGGGSFPTAPNVVQLRAATGLDAVTQPSVPILWYKAYGVDAVLIAGAESPDFWRPHLNGRRFDGVLPIVWEEQDTRIYAIPRPARTLAHVIGRAALVSTPPTDLSDTGQIEKYVAAIESSDVSPATFTWWNEGRARIHAMLRAGDEVISVQVTYHPGWKARSPGHRIAVSEDALGQLVLAPDRAGAYDIDLAYDGGIEGLVTRVLSATTILGVAVAAAMRQTRRRALLT